MTNMETPSDRPTAPEFYLASPPGGLDPREVSLFEALAHALFALYGRGSSADLVLGDDLLEALVSRVGLRLFGSAALVRAVLFGSR